MKKLILSLVASSLAASSLSAQDPIALAPAQYYVPGYGMNWSQGVAVHPYAAPMPQGYPPQMMPMNPYGPRPMYIPVVYQMGEVPPVRNVGPGIGPMPQMVPYGMVPAAPGNARRAEKKGDAPPAHFRPYFFIDQSNYIQTRFFRADEPALNQE